MFQVLSLLMKNMFYNSFTVSQFLKKEQLKTLKAKKGLHIFWFFYLTVYAENELRKSLNKL
jgi:hypothetical protein